MKCFLYFVFILCFALDAYAELGEQHTHIIFRPPTVNAEGKSFPVLPIVHQSDSATLSFLELGGELRPSNDQDDYARGLAQGRAEMQAQVKNEEESYQDAKRRIIERASVAESGSRADNDTCKFPKTHIHFYMPHSGPVNPVAMMPFMHPGAAMGMGMMGMVGGFLDVTTKADTNVQHKAEASTETPDLLSMIAAGSKTTRNGWREGWQSVNVVDLPQKFLNPESSAELEDTNGQARDAPDPCDKVPQMHLHIYDPTSGHRAATVVAPTYGGYGYGGY